MSEDFQEYHLPKACKFCSNMAAYSPLHELDSSINKRIAIYFCVDCKAEYLYWRHNDSLYTWSLYTNINDKVYRWSVIQDDDLASLWLVKVPGVPGIQVNKGVSHIKSFDAPLPDITPTNINEKIRTWLVFL